MFRTNRLQYILNQITQTLIIGLCVVMIIFSIWFRSNIGDKMIEIPIPVWFIPLLLTAIVLMIGRR